MTYSCECQTQRWSSLACWCPTWLAVAVTAALSKQLPYGTWLSCSRNSHSNATHRCLCIPEQAPTKQHAALNGFGTQQAQRQRGNTHESKCPKLKV